MAESAEDQLRSGVSRIVVGKGLPHPKELKKGAWFAFGDKENFVVGQIVSLGYGPNEGLSIYVSPPRFRGKSLKRLELRNEEWVAAPHEGEVSRGNLIFF